MYILDVIPLFKIPLSLPQVLSYFSAQEIKEGGLVLVPLRKKKVLSLVVNSQRAEEKKIEIKKAGYGLKKIEKVILGEKILPDIQLSLAQWLSQHYLASLGPSLKLFFPQKILKSKKRLQDIGSFLGDPKKVKQKHSPTPVLFWGKNVFQFYLKEIEKCHVKGKQILFLVPEIENLEKIRKKIKGSFVSVFHSNLKSSEEFKVWQSTKEGKSKIILGTRSALFLPFQNLGLIIVDKEENSAYESWGKTPKYNAKTVALKLGEISGAKVILGTELPTVESYYRFHLQGTASRCPTSGGSRGRTSGGSGIEIIDMREEIKKGNFSIFSQKLVELLQETFAEGGQIPQGQAPTPNLVWGQAILFINRRGLSTSLLCQECGWVFKCKNCDVPLVYHLKDKRPILLCHHCGQKEMPPGVCPNCQGWRLKRLGKGTQKVSEELRKLFPKINVSRIDSDIAPTLKEQKMIVKDFANKKADILVTTQLLLKFQDTRYKIQDTNLVGVVLIDPLLNLPEFRSRERVFQILTKLQDFGQKMVIQTYNPELSIFQYLKENKIEEFFKEELKQRKVFSYPPFSEIVRLTFAHKDPGKAETEAQNLRKELFKTFSNYQLPTTTYQLLGPAPGFIPKVRGKYVWQIIIKVKRNELRVKRQLLNVISPKWKIEVNPESLL